MKQLSLLLSIFVALVVYGSLYPWQFDFSRHAALSWPNQFTRFVYRDIALNILLYIPIGGCVFLLAARRFSKWLALALAAGGALALSMSMELLQIYIPHRDPSLLDVTTNLMGACAGAIGGLVFGQRLEKRGAARVRKTAGTAVFLLAAWVTCQTYPFFPALSRHKLYADLLLFENGWPPSAVEWLASTAEWFAVGLALRSVSGRSGAGLLAVSMGLLVARPLLVVQRTTPAELTGAVCALLLWLAIRDRARFRAGVWLMAIAIVLRELAPFRFSAPPVGFSWIPFQATFLSDRQSAVVVLARKAFDYGAAFWLLRKNGIGRLRAVAGLATGLLILEAAQQYLPGRSPEVTDCVVALLMGLVLSQLDRPALVE